MGFFLGGGGSVWFLFVCLGVFCCFLWMYFCIRIMSDFFGQKKKRLFHLIFPAIPFYKIYILNELFLLLQSSLSILLLSDLLLTTILLHDPLIILVPITSIRPLVFCCLIFLFIFFYAVNYTLGFPHTCIFLSTLHQKILLLETDRSHTVHFILFFQLSIKFLLSYSS